MENSLTNSKGKMDSIRMHLTLLPQVLFIASLKPDRLHHAAYLVLKRILEEESTFFSLTETEEELSLILGEEDVKYFQNVTTDFELCPTPWRALQVCEGDLSFGEASMGIVHAISEPLARAGISIFNISTSDTDFTLVPQESLHSAIACLKERFTIMTEGLKEEVKEVKTSEKIETEFKRHPLKTYPEEMFICSFRRNRAYSIASYLMKIIFFPPKPRKLLSLTIIEDEISVVCDKASLDFFPSDERPASNIWKLIKVDDGPLGFAEYGIVCGIAERLSKISLFYLSTFFTDYLLVEDSSLERATASLVADKFEIRKG